MFVTFTELEKLSSSFSTTFKNTVELFEIYANLILKAVAEGLCSDRLVLKKLP